METRDERRRRLAREATARWRSKNIEKVLAYSRAYEVANRDKRRAKNRTWHAANREQETAKSRAWHADNRAAENAKSAAWRLRNLEYERRRDKLWRLMNPGKQSIKQIRRRTKLRAAIPLWADEKEIGAVYAKARRLTLETGVPHHVDHYYPLRGRNVSGLHVTNNLRVVPAAENLRKSNRLVEE